MEGDTIHSMTMMVKISYPIVPFLSDSLRAYSKEFAYTLLMLFTIWNKKLYTLNISFLPNWNIFIIVSVNALNRALIIFQMATILWEMEMYKGLATFYINKSVAYLIFRPNHLPVLFIFLPTHLRGLHMYLSALSFM